MSGKRYPDGTAGVGRTLTEFGNELAGKDYDNINSEWQQIALGSNFIGVPLENTEYLLNNVKLLENNLIFVFDFAITAISLYRDFLFFLPNFMNAVVNYIAGILYNALDSLLRLGVYSLVVPPDLTDTGFKGLPTTNLKDQAKNAYRKFYDYADPNIPYYLPFEKNLAEEVIDSGEAIKNKYKSYFESSRFAEQWNVRKPYMERDFQDFEKSVQNLARPGGIYDAIYLYFSISYTRADADAFIKYIEAVSKVAALFKFPTIESLLKEYDSLLRPKRKRVKVLCVDRIKNVKKSSVTKANQNLRKVDIQTKKQVYVDPDLENFRIFESDPISSMTPERRDKLVAALQEQLNYDIDLLNQINAEGLDVLVEFNKKNNVEYQQLEKDIELLEDEIVYYELKNSIINFLNSTPNSFQTTTDFDNFYNNLKSNEIDFSPNKPGNYANALSFISLRTEFYSAYTNYNNLRNRSAGAGLDTALNSMLGIMNNLYNVAQAVRNEIVISITPPDIAQAERKTKLEEKKAELEQVAKIIEENTEDYIDGEADDYLFGIFKENDLVIRIQNAISEKKKHIDFINGKVKGKWYHERLEETETEPYDYAISNAEESINDLSKSAKITFCTNYYPNSGRTSLYESYLEKFYNFNTIADSDYMYEFALEVDNTSSDGLLATKVDSFHSGQFVQIREKVGSGYEYRGSGIIIAEVEEVFEDAGVGTWVKANFSDIIGVTADIKRLQNEVLGFQNLFQTNSTHLDAIIEWLKETKSRILELIDILENLISFLQLLASIQLDGSVMGKYIRNEEYDRVAIGLTDTSKLNIGTNKRSFKPSNLASVTGLLSEMATIDPQAALDTKNSIDAHFAKTSVDQDEERKKVLSDNSVVEAAYPARSYIVGKSQELRDGIKAELDSRLQSVTALFDIGSAAKANLDEGIIPITETEKQEKERELSNLNVKIWTECVKANAKVTDEFGFSLILLSYLPKGLPFYPIRALAQQLGLDEQRVLVDQTKIYVQDLGSPTQAALDSITAANIKSLMPNKTKQDLMAHLTNKSITTSPTRRLKPKPEPIDVRLQPLVTTIDFNFSLPEVQALQSDSTFLNASGSTIKILKSLNKSYLAGAKLLPTNGSAIQIGSGVNPINSNYKYRYEFELSSGNPGGCGPDDPELDKIQVHFGIFKANQPNITVKAVELNGDGNQIFRFGRRTTKTFKGDVYLKQDRRLIIPYILIGYDDLDALDMFTFELKNTQIYFYRVT